MNWLDRYINAVKTHLPKKLRQDVGEELKSLLLDQLEALGQDLGREPNEEDVLQVLKNHGHPMEVAAGYQEQRVLISERVFPAYKRALRITLTVVVAVIVGSSLLSLLAHGWGNPFVLLSRLSNNLIQVGLMAAAIVTLVFFNMDNHYSRTGFFDKWDPRSLPKPQKKWVAISPFKSIMEILMCGFLLVWMNSELLGPAIIIKGHIVGTFHWSEAMVAWLPWINLSLSASLLLALVNLFKPRWTRLRLLAHVGISAFSVWILLGLLSIESPFFVDLLSDRRLDHLMGSLDPASTLLFTVILLATSFEGLRDLYRAATIDGQ